MNYNVILEEKKCLLFCFYLDFVLYFAYFYCDWEVFVNPVISNKYGKPFISEEGCLSLEGIREAKRYKVIDLLYRDPKTFKIKSLRASGGTAVIIQHEVDHCNGIVI